ncbi:hypothetical protein EDB86DRAFT_3126111 [Lactarius hatsudake]|nr:hypothetical protein EDB86DRAFT_3126111 [Lactarius hatsudake]
MKQPSDLSSPTPKSNIYPAVCSALTSLTDKVLRSPGSFCAATFKVDATLRRLQSKGLFLARCKGRAAGPGRLAKRKASDLKETRNGLYYWKTKMETTDASILLADVFKDNVQKHREQFFQLLGKVLEGSIDAWSLIDHSAFWTDLSPPQPSFNFNTESQAWSVTEASQREDFIDQSPLEGLQVHIVEQLQLGPSSEAQIYGRYCSIVQSSGMGKLRLLDEFSKNFFLIPINLRASTDQGYPPADSEVRNFLTQHDGVHSALSLMQQFLLMLFSRTKATLEHMGSTKSGRIREFQEYMSKDQTMHSSGGNRLD